MSATPQQTTQLLLDALRPGQTAVSWQTLCQQANIDWDDLAVRAIVLGLAPQLHHRLSSWQAPLPPKANIKLLVTHQAQQQRAKAIYQQLADVLQACRSRQLQPLALKGVHLAATAYAEPALRPMNDIDLLFRPEQLPQAETMLTELGYGGKYKSPELGAGVVKHTSTFRRTSSNDGATPNPYLSANSDRTIEPHASLEESWFGLKVDVTPGVWQRSQTAVLANQPCLVLSPEDSLLHICVHFCFHLIQGAPSMVQFTDLLAIAQTASLDWPQFCHHARQRRAAPFALAALTLAQTLLGAPVPETAVSTLHQATPSALRQRIANLGLADILHRTQQKPLVTLSQRLQRGLRDRAETARWAPDWRGRWHVWRTLLQPSRTDTGQMLTKQMIRD